MSVKLLLDENLSPAAAVALIADGVDAYHLRDRGILGATDQELLERAYQEDRVLVTSNVDDFAKLARARGVSSVSTPSPGHRVKTLAASGTPVVREGAHPRRSRSET